MAKLLLDVFIKFYSQSLCANSSAIVTTLQFFYIFCLEKVERAYNFTCSFFLRKKTNDTLTGKGDLLTYGPILERFCPNHNTCSPEVIISPQKYVIFVNCVYRWSTLFPLVEQQWKKLDDVFIIGSRIFFFRSAAAVAFVVAHCEATNSQADSVECLIRNIITSTNKFIPNVVKTLLSSKTLYKEVFWFFFFYEFNWIKHKYL